MIKTGKIIDSTNNGIPGANIIESDNTGKYITPITKVIETDVNGNFTGDFKPNTFYTATYIGTKKVTFNSQQVPDLIKLLDDNTLQEITVESKRTYYWLIPIGLLLLIALRKNKL
jgi:hypothetical protein